MDPEIKQILSDQGKWLLGRCRSLATAIVMPGQPSDWAAVKELTAELNQAVLVRFLAGVRRGWFDQAAYVARAAQVRSLLSYCLMQERKVRFAQREKDRHTDSSLYDADDDQVVDVVDRLLDHAIPHTLDVLVGTESIALVIEAVRKLASPARRLAILIMFRPAEVVVADFVEAASYFVAGRRFLERRPEQAWTLLQEARKHPDADDATWWRRTVAEICRFDVPLGQPSKPSVNLAVNALEKQLEHALDELRAALVPEALR